MGPSITLQFQSLDDLWAFRIEALVYFIAIDPASVTLTCKCNRQHLQLAVSKYKAHILLELTTGEQH
jgi:hypothetical protein